MEFAPAVRRCLTEKYCSFKGRASRSEFWWFALFMLLINVAVNLVSGFLPSAAGNGLSALVSLAFILPNIGVTARRLHDRNLSGWWQLAPIVPTILLLAMIFTMSVAETALVLLSLLAVAVAIWFLIMLILPGTPGPNRFGPDPLRSAPRAALNEKRRKGRDMTFAQAVRVCLKDKYCNFRGRASRSEFWWFMLCIGLINLAANIVLSPLPPKTAMGLNFLVSLALLLPNLGVTVRRLHDRNLAGWWLLVPILSLLLWLPGRGASGGNAGGASALLSLSMCICILPSCRCRARPGPTASGPIPWRRKTRGNRPPAALLPERARWRMAPESSAIT